MPNVVTTKPNRRLTQPGHPSAGRRNEYWRWLRQPLGKKWQVLHNSRLCYQDCWHTDPAQSASKGMSSHATDLRLCEIFLIFFFCSIRILRKNSWSFGRLFAIYKDYLSFEEWSRIWNFRRDRAGWDRCIISSILNNNKTDHREVSMDRK